MTDERKKQLVIVGAVAVGALILLAFFRTGKTTSVQPIVPDGSMGTLGLVNPGPVGSGITYNIPPYVPPNQPQTNFNIPAAPSIPAPSGGCCNVCEGPTYVGSETIFLQNPPAPVLQWYQNTVPPPPPPSPPLLVMGRNALAQSIDNQRALIQDLFGYGSSSNASAVYDPASDWYYRI